MSRREFTQTLVTAGAAAAVAGVELRGAAAPAAGDGLRGGPIRNVVLVLTDDQGYHLGCLGTAGVHTPVADGLAQAGALFTEAFATCTSCSPSRSAILTGMYPHANGHWRNTHTPHVPGPDADYTRDSRFAKIENVGVYEHIPTLVEILNREGFETGITSKFHLSPVWKYPFTRRIGASRDPESVRQAMTQFMAATAGRPFFLMANVNNTHRPFKTGFETGYPPVEPKALDVPPSLPDTPPVRRDLADYLTTVQDSDAALGHILDVLRAAGRLEDTLIIFTSDQGYAFQRAKATAYDAGLRVPFIVSGPGVKRGMRSPALVSHVDILPTILAALGLDIPTTVQGRSLWPLLEGRPDVAWRDIVFAEHNSHGPNPLEYYPIRSACDGHFHYLRNLTPERVSTVPVEDMRVGYGPGADFFFAGPADSFPGGPWGNRAFAATVAARDEYPLQFALLQDTFRRPPEELYDLHADPGEVFNVVNRPEVTEHLQKLRQAVDRWMEETGDPGVGTRNCVRQ